MASITWRTAGGGAFDDVNNWSPSVVPGSADTALFNDGAGGIASGGSVAGLQFNAGRWAITGQIGTNTATLNASSLTIDGASGQLAVSDSLIAGNALATALNVFDAGTLSASGPAALYTVSLTVASRGVALFGGPLALGVGGGSSSANIVTGLMTASGVVGLGASAGSTGTLVVQSGGEALLNSASDATTPYLQLGAAAGGTGVAQISGAGSLLLLSQNSTAVGDAGTGELDVVAGGAARLTTTNNGLNPALVIGRQSGSIGTVSVTGAGSAATVTGSVLVGSAGTGTLLVTAGASLSAVGLIAAQAALAVSAGPTGAGRVVIDGAGSLLAANGLAIIGGDNRGAGQVTGGVGTIQVSNGGTLQSNGMILFAGSSVSLDASSAATITGALLNGGGLTSAGTLTVAGTLSGGGTLTLSGGSADIATLGATTLRFASPSVSVRLHGVTGTSQVAGMTYGDVIDLVGDASAHVVGNTIATNTGTLAIAGAPAGAQLKVSSDGNGGSLVSLGTATVGVFRFFDTSHGTHFFSSSASEKATIIATRPDLVYEGIGLNSIDPASPDPNAAPVFRFFDSIYGTHFFTASTAERDLVIATRPDLLYEGTGFVEHTSPQPGDVAVYRFFDTNYGTHFYTGSASEKDLIRATRADLAYEGVGFYAPA